MDREGKMLTFEADIWEFEIPSMDGEGEEATCKSFL